MMPSYFHCNICKILKNIPFLFYENHIITPQPQILKKNTKNEPRIFLSDSYYHFFHIQSQLFLTKQFLTILVIISLNDS